MNTDRIKELAQEYIDNAYAESDHNDYDAFLEEWRDMFRKNASHLSDCFADTRYWIDEEEEAYFTEEEIESGEAQDALEKAIVDIIMEGQSW